MKWFLPLVFFVSFNSFADLRVVVPTNSSLTNFNLREGELVTSDDAKRLFIQNSVDSVPVPVSNPSGVILAFGGTSAPAGYLMCDGSTVSRTEYADLFAAIGTAFGAGDGSTTFNVPDLRGRFLRGVDGGTNRDPDKATRTTMATGGNAGDEVGSIQSDAFQGHRHFNGDLTQASGSASTSIQSGSSYDRTQRTQSDGTHTGTHGTPRVSNETRPMNTYVHYIIKY